MNNSKPKWTKWVLMPNVEIWKAVALSLNTNPDQIKLNKHSWMTDGKILFDEGQNFNDRLDVLKANIGHHDLLKRREDCPLDSINLISFAKWTTLIGWNIPLQLDLIAEKYVDNVGYVEINPEIINGNEDIGHEDLKLSRREQQLEIILAVIYALNYQPLQIPTAGKTRIKTICLKLPRSFTPSGFGHAWKKGLSNGLFKLLDSDKFSGK